MNYLKVYCNLIRKAENRTPPEGYTEKHHTFPKSIYGKNNRLVVLTAREHYVAHALLEKICIKRYGLKDKKTHKMIYAHTCMKGNRDYYVNSYLYECAMIRRNLISKGKKLSPEARRKIGDAHKGKVLSNEHIEIIRERMIGENNINYGKELFGEKNGFYGKQHTLEQKEKWSEIRKGVKLTEETKRKIGEFNKGKVLSTETIEKMIEYSRKKYKFISPIGELVEEYATLTELSKKYHLDTSALSKLVRGIIKQHKGWTLYKPHTPLAQ
jgi:hypothetical protein